VATLTQLTLDADGTIGSIITIGGGGSAPYYAHCNDAPDGLSSDFIRNDASETTGEAWFSLTNVDADFSSMDTLDIDVDVQVGAGFSDDSCDITARIYDADNDTTNPLTAETATLGSDADTSRTQRNVSFSALAGTKAQWDAAYIRFTWTYSKSGSPDNGTLRFYGCDIDGTYTASGGSGIMGGLAGTGGLAGISGIAGEGGGLVG